MVLISLARRGRGPVCLQTQQALPQAIRERRLRPGSAMPSTRTLAADLGVSRGVVVEAYSQLIAEGYWVATLDAPCHPEIRRIITEAGLATVSATVDEEGLDVDTLGRTRAKAVLVSPAHQNPMGGVLTPSRRHWLLIDRAVEVERYLTLTPSLPSERHHTPRRGAYLTERFT